MQKLNTYIFYVELRVRPCTASVYECMYIHDAAGYKPRNAKPLSVSNRWFRAIQAKASSECSRKIISLYFTYSLQLIKVPQINSSFNFCSVCVCVRARARACVCVCVCVYKSTNFDSSDSLSKRESFYSTDCESALVGCRSRKMQRIERKLHSHKYTRYRR